MAALAALAAAAAVWGLAGIASKPSYALLYAGLDASAAGGVVSALEARQVAYEVRGDAIYVAEGQRDALRMSLAAEGRPANGAAGYEILDDLSGFGTTAEMFDAAYWRAKEGELARTILALPGVRRARVHIANPRRRPFERAAAPSASVAVSVSSGALSATKAKAIRHLVSSAVAGLMVENVTVIDAENGVAISGPESGAGTPAGASPDDRAATLKRNIERLLEARVGAGAAVVEVNVDADMNSETVRERVLDPDSRVAIHSDVEENADSATGGDAGAVTVASNLPDKSGAGGGDGGSSSSSGTRERVNYEVSEVLRERVRRPGEIRRISVAVLVDGVRTAGPDGAPVWTARPEEELAALKGLVESAIGFDAARGDVVSIETMEFTRPPELGAVAERDPLGFAARNAMSLVQLGVFGLVTLVLGLFVLRPMLAARAIAPAPQIDDATLIAAPDDAAPEGVEGSIAAAGDVIDARSIAADRLVALRDVVDQRKDDAAMLLVSWLENGEIESENA